MTLARNLPFFLAAFMATCAHASVYKCVDANGRITYTNDSSLSRGCTRLSQDLPVSSVPPPARPAKPATSGTTSTQNNFPRVDPGAQRARDDTRRQILEQELASEQSALATAQSALTSETAVEVVGEQGATEAQRRLQPYRDKVELHQRNIDALQREIGGLR